MSVLFFFKKRKFYEFVSLLLSFVLYTMKKTAKPAVRKGEDDMTIILVQENKSALKHLKQLVEECYPDSTILPFSSAEEALGKIREADEQIDLCFTEIMMHGPSGLRLIEELRWRNRRAKAVLVARDKDHALEAWRVGANDYLIEPLTIESIRHAQLSCS